MLMMVMMMINIHEHQLIRLPGNACHCLRLVRHCARISRSLPCPKVNGYPDGRVAIYHSRNIKEDNTVVKEFAQNTEYKGTDADFKFEFNRQGRPIARSHTTQVQTFILLLMSHSLCKYFVWTCFLKSKMGPISQVSEDHCKDYIG